MPKGSRTSPWRRCLDGRIKMADSAQDRLARLEARVLRLEQAFVAMAECPPVREGRHCVFRDAVSVLLSAIRRDVAEYERARGGQG